MKRFRLNIAFEWRQVVAGAKLDTLLLFAVSATFSIYLALGPVGRELSAMLWAVLYWVLQVFTAIQISERMYGADFQSQKAFYYQNSRPEEVLLGKLLVQSGLQLLLALVSIGLFMLLFGTEVHSLAFTASASIWGSLAITALFQVVGAVASATSHPARYTALLGTPIAIPVMLEALRATKRGVDGLAFSWNSFATLPSFTLIALALAVLLYPHIWHE